MIAASLVAIGDYDAVCYVACYSVLHAVNRSLLITFISGRYNIHTGTHHGNFFPCKPYGLPLEYPTLAEELKNLGYGTHMIGEVFRKVFDYLWQGKSLTVVEGAISAAPAAAVTVTKGIGHK